MNNKNFTIQQLHKILQTELTTDACHYYLDQISDYITYQFIGEDYRSKCVETAVHLDSCPNCSAAYARLYELEFAAAQESLPELTNLPAPDFSFLNAGVVTENGRLAKIKSAIQEIGDKFVLVLTEELVGLLRPLPNTTPVLRSSSAERYAEIFFQLDPTDLPYSNLPFTITAFRDAQMSDNCLVEVRVQPPEQSWPTLSGKKVNLKMSTQTIAGTTDAWGLAVFNDVRITNLATATIEVSL
ncbi:MAG: hypothetical protein KDE48_17205 [Anaerolineales bacterium]|nr:hypothetical protein [Anaerolineales bacterium]